MSIQDVIAETGLDLSDSSLGATTLAVNFAERLSAAWPFPAEALTLAKALYTSLTKLTGTSVTPFGVYGAAFSALTTAAGMLEGRLDSNISDNYKRLEAARNLTIQSFVKVGDWSTVVPAGGVPVGKLDLKNQVGGWDEAQFLAQYNPGIVWMARKPGADILLPTWPSPPFTSGYGFRSGPEGTDFVRQSPITGFGRNSGPKFPGLESSDRPFYAGQPQVPPFPAKYDETYFGSMPSATEQELAQLYGEPATKLKNWERLIQKIETNLFARPFAPPPNYTYCFSVGTYPYTSWSTSTDEQPLPSGSPVVLNGTMAAIAAAIHSFTTMHAAIDAREVARCYRAWQATSRLYLLPPDPKRQFDAAKCPEGDLSCGVYLDKYGLPTSEVSFSTIQLIQELPPGAKQDPRYPKGYGPSIRLNWAVARSVEQSFRSFFRIRRAATYQMDKLSGEFIETAKKNPEPAFAAAAYKKPPPYVAWSERDPLGDGLGGPVFVAGDLKLQQENSRGPTGLTAPTRGGGTGGVVVLGGLGLLAWRYLTRRR